jgi:hypothetical protein
MSTSLFRKIRQHPKKQKTNLVVIEDSARLRNEQAGAISTYGVANSSNNAFAPLRSRVSKPSVNQP